MKEMGGARLAIVGLLFMVGALPVVTVAGPIRDLPREETSLWVNAADSLSVVGDVVREVRRTGPGVSPGLTEIDDGAVANGSLLHSELREQVSLPLPIRAANTRRFDNGPDLLSETVNGALKATRDALFDGADAANFSLAGIDLNVTVRGPHWGVSVNGVDLIGSNQPVAQLNEWSGVTPNVVETTNVPDTTSGARQMSADADVSVAGIMANLRRLALHPLTIIAGIVLAGLWLMALVMDVSRSRRG